MARINVEATFWLDILQVAARMGDPDKAIGNVLRFWRDAQERFKTGKLMTELEFDDAGYSRSIMPTFAKITGQGIEAVGAWKHFGWLKERADAGRRGGKSKSEKKTKSLKQNSPKKAVSNNSNSLQTKQNRSKTEATPNPLTLTLSLPLTQNSSSLEYMEPNKLAPTAGEKVRLFFGAFTKGFQGRFNGASPDFKSDPKLRGQIGTYAKKQPDIDRACALIQVFFQMDNDWFETRTWDFSTFLGNIQKVAMAYDTGQEIKPKNKMHKEQEIDMAAVEAILRKQGKLGKVSPNGDV